MKSYQEKETVRFGTTIINYSVVRSTRRKKTVEITLDPNEGVLVAAPLDAPPERIREVVRKRAGWIVGQAPESALKPRRKEFVSGESLPYMGREAQLFVEYSSVSKVNVQFAYWRFNIAIPSDLPNQCRREEIRTALERWYAERALERLGQRTERWAKSAGIAPEKVLVRNQRQRWGSCSPNGVLRFNWRIIMAPPRLIDYVVLHELVHLRIRKHSVEFWAELSRLMPDYQIRRVELKELGPRLTV